MSSRFVAVVVSATVVAGCAPARSPYNRSLADPTDGSFRPAARAADSVSRGAGRLDAPGAVAGAAEPIRIGPNDLLDVTVLEAPELNRAVRVAATGTISLPLLGEVAAADLTPRELELALEAALRQRYIREPHVSVRLSEMQSHPVTVVGSVERPGVFQISEPRRLLEVIALAGGTANDAGASVVIVRGRPAAPGASGAQPGPETIEVSLAAPFEAGDARREVLVRPGDLVNVRPAGMVYVVGEVRRPGAFPLDRRPGLTVLQAIALGEGFGPKAARQRAVIVRTGRAGERTELPVDLGAVIAGRAVDTPLQARDVVFVPSSAAKSATLGVVDALVRMVTLRAVF